jgi:hypothetical protein
MESVWVNPRKPPRSLNSGRYLPSEETAKELEKHCCYACVSVAELFTTKTVELRLQQYRTTGPLTRIKLHKVPIDSFPEQSALDQMWRAMLAMHLDLVGDETP